MLAPCCCSTTHADNTPVAKWFITIPDLELSHFRDSRNSGTRMPAIWLFLVAVLLLRSAAPAPHPVSDVNTDRGCRKAAPGPIEYICKEDR